MKKSFHPINISALMGQCYKEKEHRVLMIYTWFERPEQGRNNHYWTGHKGPLSTRNLYWSFDNCLRSILLHNASQAELLNVQKVLYWSWHSLYGPMKWSTKWGNVPNSVQECGSNWISWITIDTFTHLIVVMCGTVECG